MKTFSKEYIQAWQDMADLTFKKCKEHCRKLGGCCYEGYCEMAAEYMQELGIPIPPMPFIKDGKCVIPPHLRQACTFHQCKISSLGFDPKDDKWTEEYFNLRAKIQEMEIKENGGW